ncbi:hypothetical protein BC833DRAFT_151036 [Globomyces pollinis-pini]|nr:hypothetical protein BC833DRAFT_151036 [Globomyces pollinis-pini]
MLILGLLVPLLPFITALPSEFPTCSNPIPTFQSSQTCGLFLDLHPAFTLEYLQNSYCICANSTSIMPYPSSFCPSYAIGNQTFLPCSTTTVSTIVSSKTPSASSTTLTVPSDASSADSNLRYMIITVIILFGFLILVPILLIILKQYRANRFKSDLPSFQSQQRPLTSVMTFGEQPSDQDGFQDPDSNWSLKKHLFSFKRNDESKMIVINRTDLDHFNSFSSPEPLTQSEINPVQNQAAEFNFPPPPDSKH